MDDDKMLGSLGAWWALISRVFWWVVGAFAAGYVLAAVRYYGCAA